MKKTKLTALILAVVMLTLTFVACAPAAPSKVMVNCTVSVVIDGEKLLDGYAYQVEGTEEKPATVLQAATEVFTECDIPYEVNDDGLVSVSFDGVTYASGNDGTNIYQWIYKINGAEPTEGKLKTAVVQEGQDIELELISIAIDEDELIYDEE